MAAGKQWHSRSRDRSRREEDKLEDSVRKLGAHDYGVGKCYEYYRSNGSSLSENQPFIDVLARAIEKLIQPWCKSSTFAKFLVYCLARQPILIMIIPSWCRSIFSSLPTISATRSNIPADSSSPILLEFPVPVIQRADLTGLQPTRDAVEMKSVLCHQKSNLYGYSN